MKTLVRFSFSLAAAVALTASAAFADGAKPIRHLVYKFDVTLATTSTVHDSGIGGDGPVSGSTDYHGQAMDEGQITVDVLQVQPDSGLVVQVSEKARNRRNNEPTMCVVYGSSAVICDQTKGGVNEEESTLLRFLGRNFVNPATVDAKNHWQYTASDSQSQETSNYTLGKADGDVVPVTYQRVLKVAGVNGFDSTTDGTLSYNQKLSVPVSITEDTMTRKSTGMGNYDTNRQQIALTLTGDSLAQAAQSH
ncbi:MAG TPA: hypothetical protein VJP85_01665 [Candidatus Baltobacteraceae bacterium]|nr:hypothetical protein [Candidatus Baltobacteraceae bacterium]